MGEDTVSLALDCRCLLGESPVWSVADQALYFVDIFGRAIHRFAPAGGEHTVMAVPEDIGCIGLHRHGGFIAGLRSGLWHLANDGTPLQKLADNPEDQNTSRFNDGRCDPAGRFLAGTIDEPKAGARAHLYRYDRRGLHMLVGGLLTSNGLAFSPDHHTLYHADTPNFTVWQQPYDVTTGLIGPRSPFIRLTPTPTDRGRPDGAAVDSEGCYWTALFEGGRICRYAPDGRLLRTIAIPTQCPTMVGFGGPSLTTLFITSARLNRPAEEAARYPHAGSLFSLRVDVPGCPEPLFNPDR